MRKMFSLPEVFDLLLEDLTKAQMDGARSYEKSHDYPKSDLYMSEDYKQYILECCVPGLTIDQLNVEAITDKNGIKIRVSGEKDGSNRSQSSPHHYVKEIKRSKFHRDFVFAKGSIDPDKIDVTLKNGILKIVTENLQVNPGLDEIKKLKIKT